MRNHSFAQQVRHQPRQIDDGQHLNPGHQRRLQCIAGRHINALHIRGARQGRHGQRAAHMAHSAIE